MVLTLTMLLYLLNCSGVLNVSVKPTCLFRVKYCICISTYVEENESLEGWVAVWRGGGGEVGGWTESIISLLQ